MWNLHRPENYCCSLYLQPFPLSRRASEWVWFTDLREGAHESPTRRGAGNYIWQPNCRVTFARQASGGERRVGWHAWGNIDQGVARRQEKTPRNMADAESRQRKNKTVLFRLYIANGTPSSVQAMANLRSICREYLPDHHEIEVVDILREPLRALVEGFLVTPTLVRLSPPVRHIAGDLSDRATVLRALGLDGKAK